MLSALPCLILGVSNKKGVGTRHKFLKGGGRGHKKVTVGASYNCIGKIATFHYLQYTLIIEY